MSRPKSITTPTGRPKLGAELEVLAADDVTWLPCKIRGVTSHRDGYGSTFCGVIMEYLDEEGGVSEIVRWDSLTWRAPSEQS